jgi:hypothetical protein
MKVHCGVCGHALNGWMNRVGRVIGRDEFVNRSVYYVCMLTIHAFTYVAISWGFYRSKHILGI